MILVRDAGEGDLPGILDIYNDAVLNTTAIWNDAVVDLENRRAWLKDRLSRGYPVLVADDGGQVVGYASFGDFRPFDGFRISVENSVYVRADQRGRGIGALLLPHLFPRAAAAGKKVMIAGITAGNDASIRLHARFGFVQSALMKGIGTKFGQRLDLVFMQKEL